MKKLFTYILILTVSVIYAQVAPATLLLKAAKCNNKPCVDSLFSSYKNIDVISHATMGNAYYLWPMEEDTSIKHIEWIDYEKYRRDSSLHLTYKSVRKEKTDSLFNDFITHHAFQLDSARDNNQNTVTLYKSVRYPDFILERYINEFDPKPWIYSVEIISKRE